MMKIDVVKKGSVEVPFEIWSLAEDDAYTVGYPYCSVLIEPDLEDRISSLSMGNADQYQLSLLYSEALELKLDELEFYLSDDYEEEEIEGVLAW